jgi:hypothetical protein
MTKVTFDAASFGSDIVNLKRATTGVDNASNRVARSAFAALLTGAMDQSAITTAVLAAYGNPKKKNGKASSSLSILRTIGAEPAEKAFIAVFAIFGKTVAGEDDCEKTQAFRADVRKAIVGYVLEEKDAPKRLYALRDIIKAMEAEYIASLMPEVTEEAEADAKAEAEATQSEAKADTLADMANKLTLALESADVAAIIAAESAIAALANAINAAAVRRVDAIAA